MSLIPGERPVAIVSGEWTLEGRLWAPAHPRGRGLVCHPHPLLGGDQDNKIVVHLVRALQGLGLATLRFNFRGVGGSGGSHDQARGEVDDARAALARLREEQAPPLEVVAGYSFGSYVGMKALVGAPPLRVVVAPPVELYDFSFLAEQPGPLLILAGEWDPICDGAAAHALAALCPGPVEVQVRPRTDHVFNGAGPWIREQLTHFVEAHGGRPQRA